MQHDGDGQAAAGGSIEVRAVQIGEWQRLRSIRLEALADSPEAFITTHAEASDFPQDLWEGRVAKGAAGESQITVIGIDGDDTVAMAVGLWDPGRSGSVMPVVAVFVAPRVRRLGVGSLIMGALHEWGRANGAIGASLWVVDGNDTASRFYKRLGYRPTLDRHKITVPPVRWETRLVKPLTD